MYINIYLLQTRSICYDLYYSDTERDKMILRNTLKSWKFSLYIFEYNIVYKV